MVRAVKKSRVFLILRRSRINRKQDLETEEIWSVIERVESKITPRLRADLAGIIVTFEGIRRKGSETLDTWAGRPIRRNSVLDWLSERRLADIHWETRSIVFCRCRIIAENSGARKEMNNSASASDSACHMNVMLLLQPVCTSWRRIVLHTAASLARWRQWRHHVT